jgi:hypothetical protein
MDDIVPQSPREPCHLQGLPELDADSLALLNGRGEIIVAHHARIVTYRPGKEGYELGGQVELSQTVTAIADSDQGTIAAAGGVVYLISSDVAPREIAAVDGLIRNLAATPSSVFAVVGRPGHLDGTLVEIDPLRSAIISERTLRSDAVELTTDATGTFLGLADGMTFRTLRLERDDPCPVEQRPESREPTHAAPLPVDCCKDRAGQKDEEPQQAVETDAGHRREPCDPGRSGVPTSDGGRIVGDGHGVVLHPPGSREWNPCRSQLFFEVHRIRAASLFIIATDLGAHHIAVLSSSDLQVLHQAHFRQGAEVLSHPAEAAMLIFNRSRKIWEYKAFDTFDIRAIDLEPAIVSEFAAESMTWKGVPLPVLSGERASATGSQKVLVIPVVDPGQTFSDPDLGRLAKYFKRAGFTPVRHFYRENSFNKLTVTEFDVFGVQAGSGGPVRMSTPIAERYLPDYVGAHVDLVKTGLTFPVSLVFDGRERMSMLVQPQKGGRLPKKIEIRFSALLSAEAHGNFPVEIAFVGNETATLSLKLPSGATKTLNLQFTPFTHTIPEFPTPEAISNAQEAIARYLEMIIAAAAGAAGIPPPFAKPKVRRVMTNAPGLGLLVTSLSNLQTNGTKLEVTAVNYVGGNDPLGLGNAFTGVISVSAGGVSRLAEYLGHLVAVAQTEAELSFAERYLLSGVTVKADAGTLTSKFFIADEDGGPGATISVSDPVEMSALFDSAVGVPNTDVTKGRRLTPKSGKEGLDGLIDEVYSDLCKRILAQNGNITTFFQPYSAILIGVVHPALMHPTNPAFVRTEELWNAGQTSWKSEFRAVEAPRTASFNLSTPVSDFLFQLWSNWSLVPLLVPAPVGRFCHEFGHALGFDDLYKREAGYRTDVLYMGAWAIMDQHEPINHHCGFHKWQAGWITDDRVYWVPRPNEDETLVREVLLVPVEYWHDKNALVGAARAAFARPELPVVQLVVLDLGGNADLFGLIEARQAGTDFSQNLPTKPDPAVLVTNCIVWWDHTRYAFQGKYRAPVHRLHPDAQLVNASDSFDLARGQVFPAKGIVVSILNRQKVAGVDVFHLKVERKHSKEFIDLFFNKGDPPYMSPDVWVDWTGDNGPGGKTSSDKKEDARWFDAGQPVDQGEKIRVPDAGNDDEKGELHWIGARLRNRGNVHAEKLKINFSYCDPPGSGDRGMFKKVDTQEREFFHPTKDTEPIFPILGRWMVPPGFSGHTCILVEVADYRVPLDHTGAAIASEDVWPANNFAQKNCDEIGPKGLSPFDPIEFGFSVNNSARWLEEAYLEPEGLPYGMTLTVTPKRRKILAGETAIFRCKLELDDKIIDASCRSDHRFRINVWRVDDDSSILWGGVEYKVRPRKRSATDVTGWMEWSGEVEITGHVTPGNIAGLVRIRLAYTNHLARWVSAEISPGGTFTYKEAAPSDSRTLFVDALFEGNKYYSESRSPQRKIKPPPVIA